jgi:hypothetical protein
LLVPVVERERLPESAALVFLLVPPARQPPMGLVARVAGVFRAASRPSLGNSGRS